jgi:imidazolonepropionase
VSALVIVNIGALHTMERDAQALVDAEVHIDGDGRVRYAGARAHAPAQEAGATVVDAGGHAVLPGFIDCHTHLLWAGSRDAEFALRSRGASYGEIMAAGGGIRNTMRAVRESSDDALAALLHMRLDEMRARGVTTVEVKSGYGLSLEHELRSLAVIARVHDEGPTDLVATCLSAHAIPPEFEGARARYVDHIVDEILPAVSERKLARFCDVFVEQGAFTVDDGRRILTAARSLGMHARVHAEQLSRSGGAALAAELGAHAAGHLEFVDESDMRALADAGVVCEVLAPAQVFLGLQQRIPGRALVDHGCTVAVATDANPGSAPSLDLHLASSLAVTMAGLTVDEALLGITKNAARALALDDRGVLTPGMHGDLVVLDTVHAGALFASWGTNHVTHVVKAGRVVHARD